MKILTDTKLILLDIEGTTVPFSYVHNVLFPYSRKRIDSFLMENELSESLLNILIAENQQDISKALYSQELSKQDLTSKAKISAYLKFLISVDRKNTALKEIQGRIWKQGYELGELKSTIFPDTLKLFHYLSDHNIRIAIFSSGSIETQKNIFQCSDQGDLTSYINNYFDTNIGSKKDITSYQTIAKLTLTSPTNITFITDIKEEAEAAYNCGYNCFIMNRPGNKPQGEHSFKVLNNFNELLDLFSVTAKIG